MEMINKQFKINSIHKQEQNGIVYQAIDLLNNNNNVLLKVFSNNIKNDVIIDFLINNFTMISSIQHPYIVPNLSFDLINNVDNKHVYSKQYFYTMGFVEAITLKNFKGNFAIDEVIDIMIKICEIIDYLHFRGKVYVAIEIDNLLINKSEKNLEIYLKDYISANESNLNQKINSNYKSNDKTKDNKDILYDYIWKLAVIGNYLLGKVLDKDSNKYMQIRGIVKKLYSQKVKNSYRNISEIISDLEVNKLNYKRINKKYKEVLNFKTPIVGRDEYINFILDINKEYNMGLYNKKLVAINGVSGVGKTRLLKEISYRLKMEGSCVYTCKISENKQKLKPIIDILRKMINDCQNRYDPNSNYHLIIKYGSELVKIIPELSYIDGITPSALLNKRREELRLYNRISNFIIDFVKDKPSYIILDDICYCDEDTIKFISYMVKNVKNYPLLFIFSYNEELNSKCLEKIRQMKRLSKNDEVYEIKPMRFNINETAEFIQNILGMNYTPIKFATRIMNETKGNPVYIEEVMKNFYNSKELFINDNGYWEHKWKDYSEVKIPNNIEQVINEQLKMIEKRQYELLKCACIFKTPVSRNILSSLSGIDDVNLDKAIDFLVSIKILEKMVGDTGFTYNFNNIHTKRYLYLKIEPVERKYLHKKASIILKNIYEIDKNFNYDEIIYHCIMSDEKDKAIDYVIKFAKNMQEMMIISQAIELWNYAKELLEDSKNHEKLEVYYNLVKLHGLQGYNDRCISLVQKGLDIALEINYSYYIVNYKNLKADIYNTKNNFNDAERLVLEAKTLAEDIGYIDGYLESIKILNRIYLSIGKLDEILKLGTQYVEISEKYGRINYSGHLYNQIGVVYVLLGNINRGLLFINKGVKYFEECNNIEDVIGYLLVLNNLGVIHEEYIDDTKKAMEYFKQGLVLSKEYNLVDSILHFYNNIGEMLIRKDNYIEALKYIEKVLEVCNEYNEKSFLFIANVNLASIYSKIGEYEKCFENIQIIENALNKGKIKWQDMNRYNFFLLEFYFIFSCWDKALLVCDKLKNSNLKNNSDEYLIVESMQDLLMCYKKNEIDFNRLDNILKKSKKMKSFRNKRQSLFMIIKLSLIFKEKNYALKILKEDDNASKIYSNDYLDIKNRFYHILLVTKDKNQLLKLKTAVKSKKIYDLEAVIDFNIGNIYYKKQQYHKAINSFISSLYIFNKTVYKIPDKKLREKFVYNNIIKNARQKLNNCLFSIYGEDNNINYTNFINKDLKDILKDNKLFEALMKQYFLIDIKDINSIQMLIDSFSMNYEENLNLILMYAMRVTLVEKGFIAIKKEANYQLLAKHNVNDLEDDKYIYNIIDYVNKSREEIIINTMNGDFDNQIICNKINEDVTGLICLPIIEKRNDNKTYTNIERRKFNYHGENKIVAYLYLETDKLINRINKDIIPILNTLASLAFVNIDNYNLKVKSSTDKLMGIKNREFLEYSFDDILKNVKKEDTLFSIIIADIDKFKNVNDKYGHQKGDKILKEIGSILLNSVRNNDIVGRYGGEEFLIILHNVDEKTAEKIAEKIRLNVGNKNLLGKDNSLTISLGISTYPKHGTQKEELIAKADQALYNAKETGRNKTVIWSNTIGETARLDKLAGIISGNMVKDQRNVLVIVEIINLLKKSMPKKDKIFLALGRLIEIVEAYQGVLITIENENIVEKVYSRQRFTDGWIQKPSINYKIIQNVIKSHKGDFLIDWENIKEKDLFTGNPNWFSLIVVPLIFEGKLKGILQLSVYLNEKEFDYETYNFVNIIGEILSGIL